MIVSVLVAETEEVHTFDLDLSFLIADFYEIVAAESNLENSSFQLLHDGKPLPRDDGQKRLNEVSIKENDMLVLTKIKVTDKKTFENDDLAAIERTRQLILTDTNIRDNLIKTKPELVRMAEANPEEFAKQMRAARTQMFPGNAGSSSRPFSHDEFDTDVQKKIEDYIRQQNIMENLEAAMEHHPESFGSVFMLYVNCKVNDTLLKAFVDCGAQATIMTQKCAERCGIGRLIDSRFQGVAKGVGTGKILGRVHSVQLCLGNQFLPCSITIIEGDGPDMLLGLDMLRRHQCCIDLKKLALTVGNESIPFLSESEIPKDNFNSN